MKILAKLSAVFALITLFSCNTVNDSVLSKEETKDLGSLPKGLPYSELSNTQKATAKKLILKAMGSILLLDEELSKDYCLSEDDYKECVQKVKSSIKNAKAKLAKDTNFLAVFSTRIPLNVVHMVELNRNALLAVSSFKSEITDDLNKEERIKIKNKVAPKKQEEFEKATEKLRISKAQAKTIAPDLRIIIKELDTE